MGSYDQDGQSFWLQEMTIATKTFSEPDRGMGADRVIGVHVMMAGGAKPADKHPSLSQFELFGRKFMRRPVTSRIDILLRSHFMLMVGAGDRQVFTADVGLIPNTSNFNFLEFWRASELIETGRAVATAQLQQLQALHLHSPDRL